MKKLLLLLFIVSTLIACKSETEKPTRESDFNNNWLFSLEQKTDAFSPTLDDSDWKNVELPHDWSVEFSFDSINGEGCTAYLPGGTGWYRKHFNIAKNDNEKVYILFDGVYNNSEYWVNGEKLGIHPYGYSPFYFDITSFLKSSGENLIAVKVDRTRYADSRWYSGSGIYRNVKLITVNKLHIPVWGTFITTPNVSKEVATVNIEVTVENNTEKSQICQLETQIISPSGKVIEQISTKKINIENQKKILNQQYKINSPELWSIKSPQLYKAVTSIIQDGTTIDEYTTTFGVRSIKFDANAGFFLNGENMKIKGVCLHHDGGLVGAAVPKDVWKRRLEILKEGGCNAVRISHNPASVEFLELCDELGILVQDEFFDEWDYPKDKRLNMQEQHDDYITRGYTEHFQKWAETDLKNTMLAHRNHPSIFQWSIGNEIEWTYPRNRKATGFFNNMNWSGNYFWSQPPFSPEEIRAEYNKLPALEYQIGTTAKKLASWTRELDTTRPVTANCILPSASFESGYADALDIVGFSYRRVMYDYAKKHYPNKIVMGTENLAQWHEWKAIEERPFVSGTFLWTGIDYMGESNGRWPKRSTASGLIDQAGFPKPSYHMYKTLWSDKPHIYICSQTAEKSKYKVDNNAKVIEKKPDAWENALWEWYDINEHWNYSEGELVIVEVISNCEKVELFQNNKSLGIKKLQEFPDRIYKWAVPYKSGEIIAKGFKDKTTITSSIKTNGEPESILLTIDTKTLKTESNNVAHIIAQLVDVNGNPVKTTNKKITFNINGNLINLGVDNGSPKNTQDYQSNEIYTSQGRAMCIVKAGKDKATSSITAVSDGDITSNTLTVTID